MVRTSRHQSGLTSDMTQPLRIRPGLPSGMVFENVPKHSLEVMEKIPWIGAKELADLTRRTTEVRMNGDLIMTAGFTPGGQAMQWTKKSDEKRGPTTNMAFNARRATSKPVVAWTTEDVNSSLSEKIDGGLPYVGVLFQSKLGMNSAVLVPQCLAMYAYGGAMLQPLYRRAEAYDNGPEALQIHEIHALTPWLSTEWFGGEQKGLYARGNDLSISVNTGSGYIGILKKSRLAAHMWYAHSRGIGILHAGAAVLSTHGVDPGLGLRSESGIKNGNQKERLIALLMGASALGKSEMAMMLSMLLNPGRLEFTAADGKSIYVSVPGEENADRMLIVDDMVAYFIERGVMWIVDLETGHYYRIDGYHKAGDNPLVDRLAVEGCEVPCVWSNVGYDKEKKVVKPEQHVTIGDVATDNPRVIADVRVLPRESYLPTTWRDTAKKVDVHIVGIPAAHGIGLPTFSILSSPQYIAITLAGLRANKGNQSIRQIGEDNWTNEGAGTLTPFSPMTDGEVAGGLMLLRQLSPGLNLFCFTANRFSIDLTQTDKYNGSWTLRRVLEAGIDFRKVRLRKHRSAFLGWIPELPETLVPPELLDPGLRLSAEEVNENALAFDTQIINRLMKIELESGFPDNHRQYLSRLRRGKIMLNTPFESFQAG